VLDHPHKQAVYLESVDRATVEAPIRSDIPPPGMSRFNVSTWSMVPTGTFSCLRLSCTQTLPHGCHWCLWSIYFLRGKVYVRQI